MKLQEHKQPVQVPRVFTGKMNRVEVMLGDMKIRLPSKKERKTTKHVFLKNTFPVPYLLTLITDEFSSICPMVGQPDYAKVKIEYVPDQLVIEQKCVRDFFTSLREADMFQEEISMYVAWWFCQCNPKYIRVSFEWTARGGIGSKVVYQQGENLYV